MKKYELVVVLDARTSQEEKQAAITTIEEALGKDAILQKDDMGAMDAAYDLSGKAGNNKIYVLSYYCELSPEAIVQVKKKIQYTKALLRSFFYAMKPTQKFFTYKELQDHFEKQEEAENEKMNKKTDA